MTRTCSVAFQPWKKAHARRLFALSVALLLISIDAGPALAQDDRESILPHEMAEIGLAELRVVPIFPLPGETVAVEIVVENTSAQGLERVELALYAGEELISTRHIDLAPNSVQTLSHRWAAPQRPKALAMTAVVDPGQEFIELDRLGNSRSTTLVVAPAPPAGVDLEVRDVAFVIEPGDPGVLRATLLNHGTELVRVPVLMEVRGQTAATRLVALTPGEIHTVETPWPTETPVYEFGARLNPRFRGAEADQDNNTLRRDLRPDVDLRIEAPSVYAEAHQPEVGRRVTLSARVVNDGREAVTAPFRTRFSPGTVEGEALLPAHLVTHGLGPGESVSFSHTVDGVPGEFEIEIAVDTDGLIREDDEENNVSNLLYRNPVPNVGRWVSIGPSRFDVTTGYPWKQATGRLSAFATHPKKPSTLFVGGQASGVWRTRDGGTSWAPVTDGASVFEVAALAVDPSNSSRVYLATRSDGVFRST